MQNSPQPASKDAPTLRWLRQRRENSGQAGPVRLGVLSGTFNPPTRAHLALAQAALRQLALDEVLFVIPEIPPHKKLLEASLGDRAQMLLLAIGGEPRFSAAITSHGLFLDIHRALAPHYPATTHVVFLAGRDAAERILLYWPYPDPARALTEMFSRFSFGVAARSEGDETPTREFALPVDSLAAQFAGQIHKLELPPGTELLSATTARECVARGLPIGEIVPDAVAAFIRQRKLYTKAGEK